jgi:hypothetical protein
MKDETRGVSRRWRMAAVLALGVTLGTMLMATPATAHFLPSISHIWSHIRPLADTRYVNRSASAGADHQNATPVTLTEYNTYTDVVQTTITTKGAASKVLIIGQFTAQNESTNSADVFAQAVADGVVRDGLYWASLGATAAPVFPRAQLSVSRVVTLGPGAHTIILQGAYYDGGATRTIKAYARAISAVELT